MLKIFRQLGGRFFIDGIEVSTDQFGKDFWDCRISRKFVKKIVNGTDDTNIDDTVIFDLDIIIEKKDAPREI